MKLFKSVFKNPQNTTQKNLATQPNPPVSTPNASTKNPGADLAKKIKSLEDAQQKISQGWLQIERDNARLNGAIDSFPVGFILTDDYFNITRVNPALELILGTHPAGKWTLLEIQKKIGDNIDIITECKRCLEIRQALPAKDLSFGNKFIRVFIAPINILKESVAILGVAILIEDITAEKLLDQSRDDFFAVSSHELKAPLTAIRGNTEMILKFKKDSLQDEELKQMIDSIHEDTVRLINMVHDFLDLSYLESGKVMFNIESLDVIPIIESVVRELESTAQAKGIFLVLEKTNVTFPKVTADKDKIKQILINLIANSVKFTEKGGIRVQLETEANILKIKVVDTGHGVAPQIQKFLFKKYHKTGEGSGIGLYISKLLAQDMSGELTLEENNPGKGATFTLSLPVAKI